VGSPSWDILFRREVSLRIEYDIVGSGSRDFVTGLRVRAGREGPPANKLTVPGTSPMDVEVG
jgi:hypothetical protein